MRVAQRKEAKSPLALWLNANGMTMREFGRRLGYPHSKLSGIIDGRAMPALALAYEIERLTSSEVSMESWLGLDIAKNMMAGLRKGQPREFQPESFRTEKTQRPRYKSEEEEDDDDSDEGEEAFADG